MPNNLWTFLNCWTHLLTHCLSYLAFVLQIYFVVVQALDPVPKMRAVARIYYVNGIVLFLLNECMVLLISISLLILFFVSNCLYICRFGFVLSCFWHLGYSLPTGLHVQLIDHWHGLYHASRTCTSRKRSEVILV